MKNTFMQSKETVVRDWYVIDATDMPLGRVASKAATMLRGKHKVTYTPHVDCGDNIIIINADKVALTGNKLENKMYYDHSRYVGGLRERTAKEMKENYTIQFMVSVIMPQMDSITLINGDYQGYIFNLKNNMKEVSILKNGKRYVFMFLNTTYFTVEKINDLLNTIVIG